MLMITKGMILACMMKGNLDSIEIDQQEIEYFIDALRQNLEGTPIKNILPCFPTTADVQRIEELPEEEKEEYFQFYLDAFKHGLERNGITEDHANEIINNTMILFQQINRQKKKRK